MSTRREWIQQAMMATVAVPLWRRGVRPAKAGPLTFDLHTHPGAFYKHDQPGYAPDSLAKTVRGMVRGGLTGTFLSLVADAPLIELTPKGVFVHGGYEPGAARREYAAQLGLVRRQLAVTEGFFALKADDLLRAQREGRVAAFLACEGGEFLDGDAAFVDQMQADGLRSLQIVHYVPSALGDLQTQPPRFNGLSPLGVDVVKRCNARRVLVDVAHASYDTVRQVAKLTTAPIILSHSILTMDGDRLLKARAITVEHAKLVADTGGVIGAWPSGFNASFQEFVENTKRLIDAVGVDHVGLGTDIDGNLNPVLADYQQLLPWGDALGALGLRRDEVEKVLGGNMLRVLRQVIG